MKDSLNIRKHAINTIMQRHKMLWISNINGHGANINSNKCNTLAHALLKSNQDEKWQQYYIENKLRGT